MYINFTSAHECLFFCKFRPKLIHKIDPRQELAMAKKRLRQWETASLQLLTPQVRLANLQFLQIYNFYKFTIFTNLQFLQIYNFYKFTIFTNLQFLQIYNFYKFTIFTNLQRVGCFKTFST
jgi:hypothetical protein